MPPQIEQQMRARSVEAVSFRVIRHLGMSCAILVLLLTPWPAYSQGLRQGGIPGRPHVASLNAGITPQPSGTNRFNSANGPSTGVAPFASVGMFGVQQGTGGQVGRVGIANNVGTCFWNNSMMFVNAPAPQIPTVGGLGNSFNGYLGFARPLEGFAGFGGFTGVLSNSPGGYVFYPNLGGVLPTGRGQYAGFALGSPYSGVGAMYLPLPPTVDYYLSPRSFATGYNGTSILFQQP